ncbi:efflux RND transporter periplasmic adaptor subunit [Thalassotalea ponticola]|uniref:efflux RND transporter periplasmic adaptor subunit n=1 Tax=Thalassotalea ponticola TaxID=1523392 RepID=UPI0025B4A797|nr:efflux RND transporter periplasmic adaptor subunit [Thalassotalea ponticola]MDN3651849.1 efflux RND transporter periplasmic adaptor subunit [Thalassotalea ponticola]
MSTNKNTSAIKLLAAVAIGAALGAAGWHLLFADNTATDNSAGEEKEKKPLYWVAPMDSNYRRDKPGKSPMGMDLIPVYEEDNAGDDFGPGAVKIAPHVINNLGVRTALVEQNHIDMEIATVGYVKYDQDKMVHVHPRVDGWIEKLFVKAEGDPVKKDQALYSLYSPQLVNAQEELLLAIKRNNRNLIDAAKSRLEALQLSPQFIQRLERSGKAQQYITFYAPQDGVVDGLNVREGFYVTPTNTLLSIAQLDQVWVEAEVFERDAQLIAPGLSVSMTLDYLPGKTWQGVVDYIYPTLNRANRTLRLRLKFDNPQQLLKPNMFAQVTIDAKQHRASLLVPKQAVIRTGKQDRVVLALGDGQFKSVAVTLGRVSSEHIEILDGIEEGDEVVTSAQFLIDSESSKNSDFERMSVSEQPASVWMAGEVNNVMADHNMVNITHEAVAEWEWPEMTMDFMVGDSVDIDSLKAGQTLHFEVTKSDDGQYQVTGIHIMSEPSDAEETVSTATVKGMINAIDNQSRIVNISREAIEKWGRPAATMEFIVDDNIDLTAFAEGDEITFTFEVRDDFVIVDMSSATEQDEHMNHTEHMDHSQHH